MALKSILSIDVDDEKFKRFKATFDKYQEQLKAMPESWKAATAEQDVMMQGFAKVTAALMAHADAAQQVEHTGRRGASETEKQARSWHSIARDTKDAAGNIGAMTRSFIKWTGITGLIGGLLGGGSLWGLAHLAGGVAGLRQTAAGIGVTPGQASAFGIDFSRFVGNPQGMLSNVAAALSDPTNPAYRPIASLLGNVQGQNAADVSVRLLQQLPRLFPGGAGQANLGTLAGAYGLTNVLSVEDIKRYLSATPGERSAQERAYRGDVGSLGFGAGTGRAYQDLITQLDRAETTIGRVFVRGLEPLAGPLEKLSQGVVDVTKSFLDAASKRHWITGLADDLQKFAKYISTDDFQNKVVHFVDVLGALADKIGAVIGWAAGGGGNPDSAARVAELRRQRAEGKATAFGQLWGALTTDKPLVGGPVATGDAMNDLLALVRQDETRGRAGMEHAVSGAGAVGLYQITPGTASQYGRDPSRLQDVAYNEQTARIILSRLVKRYHGNLDQVLAAYHSGPGAADTMRLGPAGREYVEYAHKQSAFRQVQIEVNKAAGADVNVSVQQMPTWLNSAVAFSPGG